MAQLLVVGEYQPGDSSIANGLVQAINGDYAIAGRVFLPNGNSMATAIRTDLSANIIWQRIYSAPFTTFFTAIDQVADGDFVATGSYFYSPFSGDEYIWVVKLNRDGDKVLEEAFGSKEEQSDGEDVTATSDGGFAVTGLFREKLSDRTGTRVLKFGRDNSLEWDQRFDTGVAYAIRQTRDGGYILSGARQIPDSLNSNPYVLRLDAKGNKLWEQVYTDYQVYVLLNSGVAETQTGNFVLALKSLLMEIDCCGKVIWARQSDALNMGTVALLPRQTPVFGGSLIVNNFDHAFVVALDEQGENILWSNTEISFPSGINQIILNRAGFITATGYLPINITNSQMFLAVYDSAQTIVPLK
ncbi:MAG TPA: hypothetical protein VHR47_05190 [Bacillota bacterium]|nr:hypothetical protein [Bacillota bacterium]